MQISIVVPVYHTAKHAAQYLPVVIQQLQDKFKDFELLFVIDNEKDTEQLDTLRSLQQSFRQIQIHPLKKNYGQHFATLCGYYLAKGDFIVCIDEDMFRYVPEISRTDDYRQYDAFYFHYDKNEMYRSAFRKYFSRVYRWLLIQTVNIRPQHSTFRIISAGLRDKILQQRHIFWNVDMMIFTETQHTQAIPFQPAELSDVSSSYNYGKLLKVAVQIMVEYSPLLLSGLLSFVRKRTKKTEKKIRQVLFIGSC